MGSSVDSLVESQASFAFREKDSVCKVLKGANIWTIESDSPKFSFSFSYRDIPVDFKYIAEPGMHSIPSVTLSPNQKWLGCQSLDNQIMIYDVQGQMKYNIFNNTKIFKIDKKD